MKAADDSESVEEYTDSLPSFPLDLDGEKDDEPFNVSFDPPSPPPIPLWYLCCFLIEYKIEKMTPTRITTVRIKPVNIPRTGRRAAFIRMDETDVGSEDGEDDVGDEAGPPAPAPTGIVEEELEDMEDDEEDKE